MKLFKSFKSIRPKVLLIHVIATLGYPAAKAAISEYNRLLIFTDSMTIVAFILLIGGVIYSMVLKGDFDVSGFLLKRGIQKEPKTWNEYMEEKKIIREDAFNYPLFLGFVYIAAAIVISYTIL